MTSDNPLHDELLDELQRWVTRGEITVHDVSDQWWDALRSKYPLAIGQIDWLNVPNLQSSARAVPIIPDEGINRGEAVREHAAVIREFLEEFAAKAGISPRDQIIVLGDGITDEAFEMSFDTLLTAFPILFLCPQHMYVLRPDAQWCFTYMFEFEMHFGSALERRRSR